MASGFDALAQAGVQNAQLQAQYKMADKEQEHQQKINDLIAQRQALVEKIPSLKKGSPKHEEANTALQGVISGIQDAYHPQKNPGAIEKFGHILTDHLKITNPADRAQKQQLQQDARTAGVEQTAQRAVASAPVSNAQKIQAQLREIDASNLDEDGKRRAREKVFGVTSVVKPNWQQFKLADGTIRSYDLNNPESNIPEGASEVPKGGVTTAKENIAGYEDAVKKGFAGSYPEWIAAERRKGAPSTSALNEYAASYQKAYGIKPEDMTPADWDFISRKMAYDKAIPQTTTSNTLKQNAEQQWVPVQETNTKSPGGAAPAPPRGKPTNNTPPPSRAQISALDSPAANVPAPAGVPPAAGSSTSPASAANFVTQSLQGKEVPGLVAQGNLDITKRPNVDNGDGTHSSTFSMSFGTDKGEVLVPGVGDGVTYPLRKLSQQEALDQYRKTGKNFGTFKDPQSATAYAKTLHEDQAKFGNGGDKKSVDAKPTSAQLKDEANKRNPRKESAGTPSGSGGANSSVKVGDPLMAAPNKEYQDAKTAYDGAIHRKNLMHKNLTEALKGNQQAMLSLVANHIGMTLGAQKGARINQAVWNEAVESAPWLAKAAARFGPDGYLTGVTLAPEQMKQMVQLADESTEVTKQDLDRIHDRINEGVSNPSKSPSGEGKTAPDASKAKGTVSLSQAMTLPKYKGKTKEEVKNAITKAGYLPID